MSAINKHITNIFFKNFLVPASNNFLNLQELELLELSRIFKNGRSEKHLIDFIKNNKLTHFSEYESLKELSDARTLKSLQIIETSIRVFKIFNNNDINYIPLKGSQLIFFQNQSPSIRPIRDLDILINESQINDAVKLLLQNGFFFKSKKYIQGNYKTSINPSGYDIEPLINNDGVRVEIHYKIYESTKCAMSELMWQEALKISISENKINRLPLEILGLHFIYHSTSKQGFDVGVQTIFDLYHIFSHKDFCFLKLLKFSKQIDLIQETSIFIRMFEKYKKLSFNQEVLDSLYPIEDEILEKCTKLIINNSANNDSIKLFRYGFFNLFKKSFQKSTLDGEVFFKRNIFHYILIFFNRLFRNINKYIPIFYKLIVNRNFLQDNRETAYILKRIKNR